MTLKPPGVGPPTLMRPWLVQAGRVAPKKPSQACDVDRSGLQRRRAIAVPDAPAAKPPTKGGVRLTEADKSAYTARTIERARTLSNALEESPKALASAIKAVDSLRGAPDAVEAELKRFDDLAKRIREEHAALSRLEASDERDQALATLDEQSQGLIAASYQATLGLLEIERSKRPCEELRPQIIIAQGTALLDESTDTLDTLEDTRPLLDRYKTQIQDTEQEIARLTLERDGAKATLARVQQLSEPTTEDRLAAGRAQLTLTGVTADEENNDTFSLDEQLAELQRVQLALMVTASAIENRPQRQAESLDQALSMYGLSVKDGNICLALKKLQSLYELPFLLIGPHSELLIFDVRMDGSLDKKTPLVLRESSGAVATERALRRIIPALQAMGVARLMATATMLHTHFGVTPSGVRFDASGKPALARKPSEARAHLAEDLAANEALLAKRVGIDKMDHLSRAAIVRLLLGEPDSKHRSRIEDAFMALARRRRVITSDGLWTLQTRFSRQTTREGLAQILANPKEPHEARDAAWALLHNAELRKACNLDPSGVLTVDNLDALAKRIDKLERASGDFKDGVPLHTANDEPLFRAATIGHAIELETLLNSGDGNALKILHWLEKLPPCERKMIVIELSAKGGVNYLSDLLASRLSPQYAAMISELFWMDTSLPEKEAWAAKAIKKPKNLAADLEALYEEWLYAHQQNRLGQPVPVAKDMRALYDSLRGPFMPGGAFDELCQLADKPCLTAAEVARRAELEKMLVPLLAKAKLYAPLLHTMTDVAIDVHRVKVRRWSDIAATVAVGALSTAFALRVLVVAAEWAAGSWLRTGMMVTSSFGGGTAAGFDAALALSASRQLASEGHIDGKQLTDDGLKGLSTAFMSSAGVVLSSAAVANRALSTLGSFSRVAAANVAALPITRTFDASLGAAFTDQTFVAGWRADELDIDALRTIISTGVFSAVSKAFPTRGAWNVLVSGGLGAADGVVYNGIRGRELSEGVAEGVMLGFISTIAFDQAHRMRLLTQAKTLRSSTQDEPSEPIDFHKVLVDAARSGHVDLSARAADLYLNDSIRRARAGDQDQARSIEQLRQAIALVTEHVPTGVATGHVESKVRQAQALLNSLDPTPDMVAELKWLDAIAEQGKTFVPPEALSLWRALERARVVYPGEPTGLDAASLSLPELKPIFAEMLTHMAGTLRAYRATRRVGQQAAAARAQRSAATLLARVEAAAASDSLSLAEMTRMSRAYSVLMQKVVPNFSLRRGKPKGNAQEPKGDAQELRGDAQELKRQTEDALQDGSGSMLPTHKSLDEWYFVRLRNLLTVFPLGVIDRRVFADMYNMWPIGHVEHDIGHMNEMKQRGPLLGDISPQERLTEVERSLFKAKVLLDAMDEVRSRYDAGAWDEAQRALFYHTHEKGRPLDVQSIKEAIRTLKGEGTGDQQPVVPKGREKAAAQLLSQALKAAADKMAAPPVARAATNNTGAVHHDTRQPLLSPTETAQGLTKIAEYHLSTATLGYARAKLLASEHTPTALRHRLTDNLRPADVADAGITRFSDTPERALALLLPRGRKNRYIGREIADHPNTSDATINDLLTTEAGRWAVAGSRRATRDTLIRLADDPSIEVQIQVASNPLTWHGVLRTLAKRHPDHVAKNPSAPPDVLMDLATHNDRAVRTAVAQNRTTPDAALEQLAADGWVLADIVAGNPGAPPTLLGKLAARSSDLHARAASNPSASPEQLTEWASDPSPDVRRQVAANPSCPVPTLRKLLADADPFVVNRVIGNETLPLEEARAATLHLGLEEAGTSWAGRKDLEVCDIRQLTKSADPFTAENARLRLAKLSDDPNEVRTLALSKDMQIRYAALGNPARPDDVLVTLFKPAADRVRRQVASWQDRQLLAVLGELARARGQHARAHATQ